MSTEEQTPVNSTEIPEKGSIITKIKDSFKRHTLWWIIGIIGAVVIIGLIVWGIVAAVSKNRTETFIGYNPAQDGHAKLSINPEVSYIETYIRSCLGVDQ